MMKPFFSQLQFAKPLFLLLLLVLPLLWRRWRERSPAFILWRSVIFCLLIFALAAPERVSEIVKEGERIFAFDVSRSIPAEMRQWMATQERRPGNGDRTYLFAGTAQEVGEWDKRLGAEQSNDAVRPGQTNLENLFSSLLQLPPTPRTVFLFTDGWETQGDVGRLLPSLAAAAVKEQDLLLDLDRHPGGRLIVLREEIRSSGMGSETRLKGDQRVAGESDGIGHDVASRLDRDRFAFKRLPVAL